MKKLIYLIVAIVALGLIVVGCNPVVPPAEQSEPTSLTRKVVGETYYVAKTGSDTYGDGTENWVDSDISGDWSAGDTGPWLTISHALWISKYVPRVSAGDTIIVGPGEYLEWTGAVSAGCAVKVPFFTEGAGGLTIQSSDGAANTIIDCGLAGWGVQIVSNDIAFEGFTVKNAYSVINQVSGKGHTLSNLIITNFVNYGLGVYSAHNCTFSNITIHTNDISKSENRAVKGIDIQEYGSGGNTYNTFQDITIYDIITTGARGTSYGISWEGDDAATHPSNDNSFTDLTIHDINGSYFARGLYLIAKETNAIENATFSGGSVYNVVNPTYAWGIYIWGGVKDLSISGFNVTSCLKGIYVSHSTYPPSQNVDIHSNNIYGNTEYGVQDYNGDNDVDATRNWWGDKRGPSRAMGEAVGHDNVKGDRVSPNVKFAPWAKECF